jgi:biotin transport system substrate-specific component
MAIADDALVAALIRRFAVPVMSSTPAGVSKSRMPLIGLLWPAASSLSSSALRNVLLVAVGTALLTLSAKINVPLPYVPMTMQSFVVLLIAAAYGSRLGVATILAYLAEGAMGLPVFAGPVGGVAIILGPTGGYLAGFVAAAFLMGWVSERGWDRSMVRLSVAMSVGHVVMLALGFAWLVVGIKIGADKAWLVGVAPFIAGSVVKSILGAVLLPVARRRADRSQI